MQAQSPMTSNTASSQMINMGNIQTINVQSQMQNYPIQQQPVMINQYVGQKILPLQGQTLQGQPLQGQPLQVQPLQAQPLQAQSLQAQPIQQTALFESKPVGIRLTEEEKSLLKEINAMYTNQNEKPNDPRLKAKVRKILEENPRIKEFLQQSSKKASN